MQKHPSSDQVGTIRYGVDHERRAIEMQTPDGARYFIGLPEIDACILAFIRGRVELTQPLGNAV